MRHGPVEREYVEYDFKISLLANIKEDVLYYLQECENVECDPDVIWEYDHPYLEELMGQIKNYHEVAGECVIAFEALVQAAADLEFSNGEIPAYLRCCINDIANAIRFKKRFNYFFNITEYYYRII